MARTSVTVRVTQKDRGYRRVQRAVKDGSKRMNSVLVGVQGSEAQQQAGAGITVADVASFHEFGTVDIPERSFIRGYVDENRADINRLRKREARKVSQGKQTTQQALERMGLVIAAGMQARISRGISPELESETVDRKGSTIPLIDTGTLRSSITHKVQ